MSLVSLERWLNQPGGDFQLPAQKNEKSLLFEGIGGHQRHLCCRRGEAALRVIAPGTRALLSTTADHLLGHSRSEGLRIFGELCRSAKCACPRRSLSNSPHKLSALRV